MKQPGERIPTLEEVLNWLENDPHPRARTVRLNIETKSDPAHPEYSPEPGAFAEMVIRTLKKHGVLNRVTLQSFDFRTLLAARALEPSLQISALLEDRPGKPITEIATELKADIISPNHEWLTQADVKSLHELGVRVIPWTANTPAEWKRLVALGVDGIITDHPKRLLEFRRSLSE